MENNGNSDGIWYSLNGFCSSVVLTSRVRVARNVKNFVFPARIKKEDAEQVLSMVLGAFASGKAPENLRAVKLPELELFQRHILCERGVLDTECGFEPWRGLLFTDGGDLSVTVNVGDHVRIAVFSAGLAVADAYARAEKIDRFLQEKLAFAAKPQYGYLTSVVDDSGTGMKVSVLVSVPALVLAGLNDRIIRDCLASGFSVKGYYGGNDGKKSLGDLYQISLPSVFALNPSAQISEVESMTKKIVETELRARQDLLRTRRTFIEDIVFRAMSTAKYARLLDFRESVDLLMKIKFAISFGFVTGVEQAALTALLYRIRPAHLEYLLREERLKLEPDVQLRAEAVNRARAMVIQEVLKNADIDERG